MRLTQYICNQKKTDIPRIDFHMHTNWTDGENTVKEMYQRACELNLDAVLFSEHVRKSSKGWFSEFSTQVRGLTNDRCRALVGIEVKAVDYDGNIDCTDKIKKSCDLIIGSVHRFPELSTIPLKDYKLEYQECLNKEIQLAAALIKAKEIDILGHPMGVSITLFKKQPPDEFFLSLIKACKDYNIAFEVNSKYHAEPLKLIKMCKNIGTVFSLGSDAHNINEVGIIVKIIEGEKTWEKFE